MSPSIRRRASGGSSLSVTSRSRVCVRRSSSLVVCHSSCSRAFLLGSIHDEPAEAVCVCRASPRLPTVGAVKEDELTTGCTPSTLSPWLLSWLGVFMHKNNKPDRCTNRSAGQMDPGRISAIRDRDRYRGPCNAPSGSVKGPFFSSSSVGLWRLHEPFCEMYGACWVGMVFPDPQNAWETGKRYLHPGTLQLHDPLGWCTEPPLPP
jgi:hypothetical protein